MTHHRDTASNAPFALMRIEVCFPLAKGAVVAVEEAIALYVDQPSVQTEILSCGYEQNQFQIELCYFSMTGEYKNELVWLHKAVQSVVVPTPTFTIQVYQD